MKGDKNMYINPFLAGVIATVGVEAAAALIMILYVAWRQGK